MKSKHISRLLCTAALTASLCGVTAIASAAPVAVTAQLNPDVTVQIDGAARTFYNAQGKEVHPITYKGTTYLPLRSIGELMDKNVNWDNATNTVTLGGTRTAADVAGTPDNTAKKADITFYLRSEITVVIDDVTYTFRDGTGKKVDPAVYNGSIYLPIRAIGEIMGKPVDWDSATQTVQVGTASGSDVTDFDTNNNGGKPDSGNNKPVTPPATETKVTLEQAKQIALNHAGKTASQVTFVKAEKDFDDGRWEYEIEFIVSSKTGYLEYDYEIDAATGKITSYDRDAESYAPASDAKISEAKAKNIALSRVPGATAANLYEFKLDCDDGRWEYEGKIIYKQMEYEFTIKATTGVIVEWEAESIHD